MRVILDTNVWTYLAERGEQGAFEELEDRLGLTIVIPPSLLLEALRTPIPSVRASVAAAMTSRRASRVHPLPEARLEADELVDEAQRLRPSWVRRFPAASTVRPLEAFWTRRLWQEAANRPGQVAARLSVETEKIADTIHATQRANKQQLLSVDLRFDEGEPWVDIASRSGPPSEGWEGGRLEAWRSDAALVWWQAVVVAPRQAQLTQTDTSYADWAGALLELGRIGRDRPDWNRFWYSEVDAARMPRTWIRSVLPWVQLQTKLGTGNARDAQHAAYLFDADLFVTADRRYARCLDLVRAWSPRPYALTCLVPGTGSPVEAFELALAGTRDP